MTPELYFIYDSHCPWSYASSPLLNALKKAYPNMAMHFLHCAHYNGSDCAGREQLDAVAKHSVVSFGAEHICDANKPKNSILSANFLAWLQKKQPAKVIDVLNAMQQAHFSDANPLTDKSDFNQIIETFKLSPANKVFKNELSAEAQCVVSDIEEMQDFIGTSAFPALLLSAGDRAVLLNHSLYLDKPEAIVDAVALELK